MLSKLERIEAMPERAANRMSLWIKGKNSMEELDYLKMKLGIEVILTNLTKGIIVYGLAFLLQVFWETLILHGAYVLLRRYSFGLHAKSSIVCTIVSVVLFVVIPYFLRDVVLGNYVIGALFLLSILSIYYFAPADTEKHPLIGEKKRKKLRNKSVLTCIILMIVALVVPIAMIKTMVIAGVAIQVISILPVSYKILQRSYDNYESYEEQVG
ncbi:MULTISPECIES: accessory gene regulator B family protein [Gracilibacillus]|uniref:accessory gene regulator B family protein n=1 Tax=Gracilibacillus TaxID=74385 RepID=UPI00082498E5|nr:MULTISPECIES: accessory gene regulator B family protein [Gracilibacillus]